jgi:cell division protein FtsZ
MDSGALGGSTSGSYRAGAGVPTFAPVAGLPSFPQIVLAAVVVVGIVVVVAIAMRIAGARPIARGRTIRVVGIGGAGGRAINDMIRAGTKGAQFITCDTDLEAVRGTLAPQKLELGATTTRGLGAGGDPSIGQQAAQHDRQAIAKALAGSDIVLIIAGLGGGTGSGAAPVVASIAREQGALTIGIVTKPFSFEGTRRMIVASEAAGGMKGDVDALITVRNDRVRDIVPERSTVLDAFRLVDDVLQRSVQGIVDITAIPGFINLGLADVRAVMKDGGAAVMGIGRATGEERAVDAAREAVSATLLEDSIEGATRVLLNVSGSTSLRLDEVMGAADVVRAAVDPNANMVFGANFDGRLEDEVQVTVIATGFDADPDALPLYEARSADEPAAVGPSWGARREASSPAGLAAEGEA